MIPKLHKKGKSFAGAAQYLLHDKGADTNDRVAATVTRNLATNNPEAAWRVMAATALDQSRLKVEAGIKATGRKSKDSVLHLTLSWHPDEADGLTRDEMIAAADGAITALKAEGHQALYVIHDDEPQPHIHVLVNRISPEDGRMLSSSKEKLALSKWAQTYEQARGQVYCEERVLNNRARDAGIFIRGKKDKPRHIFELEDGNDNEPWAVKLRAQQQQKDLEIRRKQIAQKARHSEEWLELHTERQAGKAELAKTLQRETTIADQAVAKTFLPRFAELTVAQEHEREEFVEREQSLVGKARNILKSIDWTGMLRQERRSVAIKEAFGLLSARVGPRSEVLRRRQQRQTMELEHEMDAARKAAKASERAKHTAHLQSHRQQSLLKRQDVLFRHQMEDSWIAAEWEERRKQREQAWEFALAKETTRAFEKTATPDDERRKAAETHMGRMRLARSKKEGEKAKKLSLAERLEKHQRDHGRDDDRER